MLLINTIRKRREKIIRKEILILVILISQSLIYVEFVKSQSETLRPITIHSSNKCALQEGESTFFFPQNVMPITIKIPLETQAN